MPHYYVSNRAEPNGDYLIHADSCGQLPNDLLYLGEFSKCEEAVQRARAIYLRVNGCASCASTCSAQELRKSGD